MFVCVEQKLGKAKARPWRALRMINITFITLLYFKISWKLGQKILFCLCFSFRKIVKILLIILHLIIYKHWINQSSHTFRLVQSLLFFLCQLHPGILLIWVLCWNGLHSVFNKQISHSLSVPPGPLLSQLTAGYKHLWLWFRGWDKLQHDWMELKQFPEKNRAVASGKGPQNCKANSRMQLEEIEIS